MTGTKDERQNWRRREEGDDDCRSQTIVILPPHSERNNNSQSKPGTTTYRNLSSTDPQCYFPLLDEPANLLYNTPPCQARGQRDRKQGGRKLNPVTPCFLLCFRNLMAHAPEPPNLAHIAAQSRCLFHARSAARSIGKGEPVISGAHKLQTGFLSGSP